MLHVLQTVPIVFQGFTKAPGKSVRHECDMGSPLGELAGAE
jgi:hypothetical protein